MSNLLMTIHCGTVGRWENDEKNTKHCNQAKPAICLTQTRRINESVYRQLNRDAPPPLSTPIDHEEHINQIQDT